MTNYNVEVAPENGEIQLRQMGENCLHSVIKIMPEQTEIVAEMIRKAGVDVITGAENQ